MKKVYKDLFILVLAVLLTFAPSYSQAEIPSISGQVSPMFTNIRLFRTSLDISSTGKSINTASIIASSVDEVEIALYLQQYKGGKWTTIKSWSGSKLGISYELEKEWNVASGYSYRLVAYGYTYSGSKLVESTSDISNSIYY